MGSKTVQSWLVQITFCRMHEFGLPLRAAERLSSYPEAVVHVLRRRAKVWSPQPTAAFPHASPIAQISAPDSWPGEEPFLMPRTGVQKSQGKSNTHSHDTGAEI